jgi:predicted negative regulator of RcsB-dependent stress response
MEIKADIDSIIKICCEDLIKIEAYSKATEISNLITDAYYKSIALSKIAIAQAQGGDIDEALSTAYLIPFPYHSWKANALKEIAKAQAEGGDIDEAKKTIQGALNTANLITDAYDNSTLLSLISIIQLEFGDVNGALKTASSIPRHWIRYQTIKDISLSQVKNDDIEGALETANLIDDYYYRNDALRNIEAMKKESELKK